MATAADQDYSNHRKFVRGFHLVALPILLINLIYSAFIVITAFSVDSVIGVLVAVALILVAFFARIFALGAQDRVIRLEERMRLNKLLPEQRRDVDKLTTGQLIALRFASDGEVGDLVTAVIAEDIGDREVIKKRVKSWRADHQRL